jgi:2-polyprenyl-3-methyl-5-hydroxy-6-metoxy-1,4-benzoquinol methylase
VSPQLEILRPVYVNGGTTITLSLETPTEILGAPQPPPCGDPDSLRATRERFATPEAAKKYAAKLSGTRRDAREKRCITAALAGLPQDAAVLDLPCGAGRLTKTIASLGFRVTGADSSPHMVEQARLAWQADCQECPGLEDRASFQVQDVLCTSFTAGQFDAVVCNRLFHHFKEPQTRIAVLRELRRICRGRIVVSFFNAAAVDGWILKLRRLLFRSPPRGRFPIRLKRLKAEAASVGLRLVASLPTRGVISPQWYAVFEAAQAGGKKQEEDRC